jgi:hypothetical protein
MRRNRAWLVAALAMGCSSSDPEPVIPIAEAEISIDGEPQVLQKLARLRTSVHALDSLTAWKPLEEREFWLSQDGMPAGDEVIAPIKFGVTQGKDERFQLVVQGFGAREVGDEPLIEHKSLVTFMPGKKVRVEVQLRAACAGLIKPCAALLETCVPDVRACGPVAEATYGIPDDARDLQPMRNPSGRTTEDAAMAACPADHGCPPEYPCAVTESGGYTCLGLQADWPMPIASTKRPLSYDYTTDARVVVDKQTGLVWQRELPMRYEGCTAAHQAPGDLCTWDEAKNYCARLTLAGRRWRLPSKIELESIIDTSMGPPTLLEPDFPGLRYGIFWTSSIASGIQTDKGPMTKAWNVEFYEGKSGFTDPPQPGAVRCVANEIVKGKGRPQDRYVVDERADTITDTRTELTWRRETSPTLMTTLALAETYCKNIGEGWRVPHVKEYLTLFDPALPSPSIHAVFPMLPLSFAIAVATRADGGVDEFYVDWFGATYTAFLFEHIRARIEPPFVRCVRS